MEVKSWATAQKIIKKYAQSQAFKAEHVESTPKNQGHIVMKMSGDSSPYKGPPVGLREGRGRNIIMDPRPGAGKRQGLIPHMEGGRLIGGAPATAESAGTVTRW